LGGMGGEYKSVGGVRGLVRAGWVGGGDGVGERKRGEGGGSVEYVG